ncbi:hypothetical protein NKH77_34080 [Streptomyces sp. M19]
MTVHSTDRSVAPADLLTAHRRAVVFDLDGVIVDSFPVMREAFAVAYQEIVGDGPARSRSTCAIRGATSRTSCGSWACRWRWRSPSSARATGSPTAWRSSTASWNSC